MKRALILLAGTAVLGAGAALAQTDTTSAPPSAPVTQTAPATEAAPPAIAPSAAPAQGHAVNSVESGNGTPPDADAGEEAPKGAPADMEAASPIAAPTPLQANYKPTALMLRGLDKITGKATDIVAPINQPVKFATLTITARTCYSTPPTEPPETTAFVQILDHRPDKPAKQVFSGWMFASTPSLNGMQHPLYDVWVLTCKANTPGVVASVTPTRGAIKPVSPNAGVNEQPPALPDDAGR